MKVTYSLCPKCAASIIVLTEEYGYPVVEKRTLSWQCNSCQAHEERTLSKREQFSEVLEQIEEQGRSLVEERERRRREEELLEHVHWEQIRVQRLVEEQHRQAEEQLEQYRKAQLDPFLEILSGAFGGAALRVLTWIIGWSIPVWSFFLLFVLSRLAEYITTSASRRLTGFWYDFSRWAAVFGTIALLCTSPSSNGDLWAAVRELGNLGMLIFSFLNLSTVIRNTVFAGSFAPESADTRRRSALMALVLGPVLLLLITWFLNLFLASYGVLP